MIFLFFIFLYNLTTFAQNVDIELEIPTDSIAHKETIDSLTSNSYSQSTIDTTNSENSDSNEVIIMPQLIKFTKAHYPDSLAKKGISGDVIADLLVNEQGNIDSIYIVKGLHPTLDSLAKKAMLQFKFKPAMLQDSTPIPVILRYAYHFSLKTFMKKIKEYKNLEGYLIEKGTRKKISDATIIVFYKDTTNDSTINIPFSLYLKTIGKYDNQELDGYNIITYSDTSGYFSFKSLPSGKTYIKVFATGYKPYLDSIIIEKNKLTTMKIWLTRENYNEYEIVVYGMKEKKEVAKRTITLTELKKVPGVSGDAVKVIQTMPGVARSSFIGGEIPVRGTNTDDSKFLVDGCPIGMLYHFGALKSTINSEILQKIDFYPGGFNVRYSDAVGGVIELTTRNPKTDNIHGFYDFNFIDASILLEGPINKKFSSLLTIRRSYYDFILKNMYENIDFSLPITILPYYWDYFFKNVYKFSPNNILSLNFFGYFDKLDILTQFELNPGSEIEEQTNSFKAKVYSHQVRLNWDLKNNKWQNTFNLGLRHGYASLSVFGFFKATDDFYPFYLRNEFDYQLKDSLKLKVGLYYTLTKINYTVNSQTPNGEIISDTLPTENRYSTSLYTLLEYQIKNLLLIPGLRVDYYNYLNHKGTYIPEFYNYKHQYKWDYPTEVNFRLTGRYKIDENLTLKGAIGTYHETPRPYVIAIDSVYGNPNLTTTKAAHFVIGNEWKLSDLDFLDIQVYYNNIWDLTRATTEYDYQQAEDPTTLPPYLDNGKGRSYGLEVYYKRQKSKLFTGWISYTLSRSERWDYKYKKWVLFEYDQTHNFQFIGSWNLPNNWSIGTRVRYTTGNPQTPIIGTVYYEDENYYKPIYGEYFSTRVDPFFQIDMKIEKKFISKYTITTVYLDIQNISYPIYKSPEFYIYNYDKTEKKVVTSIIYPSLGVKYEF